MKKTDFIINGQSVSYQIAEDGYDIFLGENKWIAQHEPYIPYADLGYEGSCLRQLEEITATSKEYEDTPDYETRLSALEEENAMLSATLDDILTNVIPAVTGESEV